MNTYAIRITDSNNKLIGQMMKASAEEVRKFISKGFTVINIYTDQIMDESSLNETIGVSDGLITV